MSSLRAELVEYLAVRRALGYKLDTAERLLGQFIDYLDARGEQRITIDAAVAWAILPGGHGGYHAHRLRHTAASEMLRGGAGLPEIGQVLGHRAAATTAIYAKVDRDALRLIARPWPGRSLG